MYSVSYTTQADRQTNVEVLAFIYLCRVFWWTRKMLMHVKYICVKWIAGLNCFQILDYGKKQIFGFISSKFINIVNKLASIELFPMKFRLTHVYEPEVSWSPVRQRDDIAVLKLKTSTFKRRVTHTLRVFNFKVHYNTNLVLWLMLGVEIQRILST